MESSGGLEDLPLLACTERCLRRGEARNGHAKRRARDVIEPDLLAEGDRCRIAAVLSADTELDAFAAGTAALAGDPYQFADAFAVEGDEGVDGEHAAGR